MADPFQVLVVDDSPTQQMQIQMVLEQGGYRVRLAANGLKALEAIGEEMPAIVVTDLQMPELNGLELVAEIKLRYPSLPVILTTAVGSESIAAKALHAGATSYVPKRELAEFLCDTVQQVLAVTHPSGGSDAGVSSSISRLQLEFTIGNAEELVPGIIARIERALDELTFCDEMEWMQIAMALDEAIVNAIFHGNLDVSTDLRQVDDGKPFVQLVETRKHQDPYRDRQVVIAVDADPDEVTFVIRDQGNGFDASDLPDPTDPANLECAGGRGLLLIHSFMDEVRHNDVGNEITMVKRKADPNARPADEEDDDEVESAG